MQEESEAARMLRLQREAQIARGQSGMSTGGKVAIGAAIAFGALIMIGTLAPPAPQSGTTAEISTSGAKASETQPAMNVTVSAPASNWTYQSAKDEMRGGERRLAVVRSDNIVAFDFPYGEQPADITVRQDPQYGFDVIFSVPSGQILCNSFSNSHLNVKFDGGPIERYGCTDASDGSSEVAFITDGKRFLNKLKSSKRTVVEAEFYQFGRQQYVFQTGNLNWE